MPMELHHSVRERFGDVLCYHFLSFEGTFHFDEVCTHISDFFEQEGISAFALFESFGSVDIIIRAWMPNAKLTRFDRELYDHLVAKEWKMSSVASFQVSTNRYHYLWPDGLLAADATLLDNLNVKQVNDPNFQATLADAGLLRQAPASMESSITLFISIPASLKLRTQDKLAADIVRILKAHPFRTAMFYHGLGQSMALFIEASIPASEYFQISNFNQAINAIGLQTFEIKTTTYLTTGRKQESPTRAIVSSADAIETRSVTDYLTAEEAEQLEHKGSFSIDIGRYLSGVDPVPNKDLQKRLQDEVLQTIVAFLNSNGGEILIGAVEENKFKGEMLTKLQEYPAVGNMRVLGIALEYSVPKDKNWDGYERRLLDIIKDSIGTNYTAQIRVKRLTFSYEEGDEQKSLDLCLIRVARLPGKEGAYLNERQFFVRSGSQTRELPPRDVEVYKSRRAT